MDVDQPRGGDILRPDELERIEREFAHGLPARAIVELFRPKGVRLSEATFRKYVQAGLLPRSRRVGRKGKHQGSQGLYPVDAVRRINAIKRMMAEGLTLEDIKTSFVVFKGHIDQAERELELVYQAFDRRLATLRPGDRARRDFTTQLIDVRARTRELAQDVARLGSALSAGAQGAVEH